MCCAQAQHGSAPTIAGKDIANPVSMILSVAMMLSWLGDRRKSEVLSEMGAAMTRSVDKVLENPLTRTRDIGGSMGCRDFAACVEEVVARA